MTGSPAPPADAPPPALRRVVEHLTLFTLGAAVSLYTIGQLQAWRYHQAFGLPALGADRGWESHVFFGAVALINLLPSLVLNPGRAVLPWAIPMALCAGAWITQRRLPSRTVSLRHSLGKSLLQGLAAFFYLVSLLTLGVTWGKESARLMKGAPGRPERYVLMPEPQALFPPAFHEANTQGRLKRVASTPELLYLHDPARDVTYAVPLRLLVCQVYAPQP